jgi:hypothetical protein
VAVVAGGIGFARWRFGQPDQLVFQPSRTGDQVVLMVECSSGAHADVEMRDAEFLVRVEGKLRSDDCAAVLRLEPSPGDRDIVDVAHGARFVWTGHNYWACPKGVDVDVCRAGADAIRRDSP